MSSLAIGYLIEVIISTFEVKEKQEVKKESMTV
jgi:hypothetical protein